MLELKSGIIVKHNGQLGKLVRGDEKKLFFLPAGYGRYSCSELDEATESNVQETSHSEKVEFLKQDFSWGEVIKVHTVGEYLIFEFIDGYELKEHGKKEISFHAFINYQNVSRSYNSLDSCLVGTLAYKYDGANSQADKFFSRMVKMD